MTALLVALALLAPAQQAPSSFVALEDVDPTILQDMRYATAYNFVGRRIDGYREPLCILTRGAARALERAQTALARKGYSLKVYDCYRPQRAVDHFARWADDAGDTKMKREFYPRVDKGSLHADGYIAHRSGHSRGSTVDVTLVKLPPKQQPRWSRKRFGLVSCFAPWRKRFRDSSVNMGTAYDCFDPRAAHPRSRDHGPSPPQPPAAARHARRGRVRRLRERVVALHAPRRALPRSLLRLPGRSRLAALTLRRRTSTALGGEAGGSGAAVGVVSYRYTTVINPSWAVGSEMHAMRAPATPTGGRGC